MIAAAPRGKERVTYLTVLPPNWRQGRLVPLKPKLLTFVLHSLLHELGVAGIILFSETVAPEDIS